jgi:hypothetical protein
MAIDTRSREVLGIEHPIVQAPMARGPTTPKLIAAVLQRWRPRHFRRRLLATGDIERASEGDPQPHRGSVRC